MANLAGEVTVKVGMEPTEELKALIRLEVRKALAEILQEEQKPYRPKLETKRDSRETLPDWAREW